MRFETLRLPLLALLAAALLGGCGVEITDPPVEIRYRESLIGAGKILQVSNTSNEPLAAVEIRIQSPAGEERSFTHEELEGFGTLELGWKKLGGWEIPAGAEVTVRCEGFLGSVRATLPDPAAGGSDTGSS